MAFLLEFDRDSASGCERFAFSPLFAATSA
jgi:hypothetical protein